MDVPDPVLFSARAVWDYASDIPNELQFVDGNVIEVTEVVSETWWRGRVQGQPGPALIFPVIYVERIMEEPSEVISPDVSSLGVSEPTVLRPSERPRQTLSLHSSEKVSVVDIPDAERKIVGGDLDSWYTVYLRTSRRQVLCEKRFREFCQAEQQLRVLFTLNMSNAPTLSALARPDLYTKKRTARTMEARRVAAEALLQFAVQDVAMATLLLTFFLGSDAEVVAVPSLEPCDEAVPADVEPAVLQECPWPSPAAAASAPFSLDDMDAFDALLNTGVAVLPGDLVGVPVDANTGAAGVPISAPPRDGQRLRLSLASFVWDGSSAAVRGHQHAPVCEVTLGDCRDSRIPLGLHEAVRGLPCPCSGVLTVIVGPRLAFGDVGQPPAIPPGANLIFVLCILGVAGLPRPMSSFARAPPAPSLSMGNAAAVEGGDGDGRQRVILGPAPSEDAKLPPPLAAAPPVTGSTLPRELFPGGRPALAATALAEGVPLPPGTIISSSGHIMPSVDAAERAMRQYLASIGQELPSPPPPGGPRPGGSASASATLNGGGIGLMQKLFGGGTAVTPPTAASAPASPRDGEATLSPSDAGVGGGIFKRLFTGSGSTKRPSVATGAEAPSAKAAQPRWGGARSATIGGGGRTKPSTLAAAALARNASLGGASLASSTESAAFRLGDGQSDGGAYETDDGLRNVEQTG